MWTLLMLAALAGPPEETEMPDDPFAPTYGEPFEDREARLLIDPSVGSKRLQAVTLLFDDGEEWILAYRPRDEHWPYVNKRVEVSGRPYWPSPNVQHVGGTHVDLESIELADGEAPWDPVPSSVPMPAVAKNLDVLRSVLRWALVQGTLGPLKAGDTPHWSDASIVLPDHTTLPIVGVRKRDHEQWAALEGQDVTLYARVKTDGDAVTLSPVSLCPGHVDHCGVEGLPTATKKKRR